MERFRKRTRERFMDRIHEEGANLFCTACLRNRHYLDKEDILELCDLGACLYSSIEGLEDIGAECKAAVEALENGDVDQFENHCDEASILYKRKVRAAQMGRGQGSNPLMQMLQGMQPQQGQHDCGGECGECSSQQRKREPPSLIV